MGYNGFMMDRLLRWYQRLDAWKLLAWILTILVLVGAYLYDPVQGLFRFGVAMATGALDYFLHRLHTPGYNKRPLSGTITALIVLLVLPFDVPIWILIASILAALLSKHLIRLNGRHIFNPAAFGLVLTGMLTGVKFGWWGDALPWLTVILGVAAVYRIKKQLQAAAFLVTYLLLFALSQFNVIAAGEESLFFLLFAMSWFFTLVMVPEPMTSPPIRRGQIGFGVLVALFSLGFSYVAPLSPVALPAALLVGNIVTAFMRTTRG